MNQANVLDEVVIPSLDELQFTYQRSGDRVSLRLRSNERSYDAVIGVVSGPLPLIWMRFKPNLYMDSQQTPVLETALGFNYKQNLIRIGRDPRDGEIVFDLELLLFGALPSKSEFASMFVSAASTVDDNVESLTRVRWGGMTALQALINEPSARPQNESQTKPRRRRKTKVEREVEDVLKRLDDAGGT